jgi:hypothetical protein
MFHDVFVERVDFCYGMGRMALTRTLPKHENPSVFGPVILNYFLFALSLACWTPSETRCVRNGPPIVF